MANLRSLAPPEATTKVAFQRALYDARNPTRRYLHAARRDAILRLVSDHLGDARQVLEVGVGADTYGAALSARGRVPIRIDLEREYLSAAHATSKVQGLAQANLLDLPFPDGTFTGILCSEVLEHLPPSLSDRGLRELARVLAPGGRMVFSTPQRFSFAERTGRLLRFWIFRKLAGALYGQRFDVEGSIAEHCNLLTRSALLRQATGAGLVAIRSETCGLYLPGVAELGGAPAARLARFLDGWLQRTPLAAVLWTQIHVFERAGEDHARG